MNVTIEKIEIISFGKLKNAVLNPAKGINILSAPNESGKTTLAAFIKFVFYGFAGTRTKSLQENERKLYTPWDNSVSEGSIFIKADGKAYKIHRICSPSGKENCEVTELSSGNTAFSGKVPGEVFFGVGEAVFARSLFFKQLTLPQSEDGIVAERLRNIAISADEEVGTQKAIKRLNDCKNELKGKMGNGLIPAAERERDALEEALADSEAMRRDSNEIRENIKLRTKKLESVAEKLSALEAEAENIDKYEAYLRLKNLKKLSQEEKQAQNEYNEASSKLKQYPDSNIFGSLTAKNSELVAQQRNYEILLGDFESSKKALNEIKNETADGIALQETKKTYLALNKNTKAFFALAFMVTAIGVGLLFFNKLLGISSVVFGIGAFIFAFIFSKKKNSILKEAGFEDINDLEKALENFKACEFRGQEMQNRIAQQERSIALCKEKLEAIKSQLNAEIEKYSDIQEGDNRERIEYILSVSSEITEKKAIWQAKKSSLENALSGIDPGSLAERAKGAYPPERDRNSVEKELRFYGTQYKSLSDLNRENELEYTALEARSGDPAVITGKLESVNARITQLSLKYKAYETAIRLINESADYMKSMVMPSLSQKADEYFSLSTGGKYSSLEIDTKLAMSFGEDFRRSCDYLSAGTRDSAYLSLRLALADVLFEGCGVPMLLDDAFVRIDDERLGYMSKALSKAAEKHQIFIFTHGQREAESLDKQGIEYTQIHIKTV